MYRIGFFLILIGAFQLFLYILSDIAKLPSIGLLLAGALCMLLGFWISRANRPEKPDPKNERFKGIRQLKNRPRKTKSKDKKDQKDNKEQQEKQ